MKISIIIPAYNEEACLGQCLESVIEETSANREIATEIIVVNNASTDRTKEIILSYPNVIAVDEPRKGLVFARRAGVTRATGVLLAHVDADCIMPKGWLVKVAEEFSEDDNLVALSGPYIYHDLSPAIRFGVKIYYAGGLLFSLINQYLLHKGAMIQGGNFVVKREAWDRVEDIYKDFSFYGEDTILAKSLQNLGRVKFSFHLPMFSSGRRLKEEGLFHAGYRYASIFFAVTFFSKPLAKLHKDIRIPTNHK